MTKGDPSANASVKEIFEPRYVLSFDVEEHDRIEAARGLVCPADLRAEYARRMEARTVEILQLLAETGQRATFFVVGEIGRTHPMLVRMIASAGHEVAAHGWHHERVDRMDAATFRDDVRRCRLTLEDAAGVEVIGYRAPCFSVSRQTPWVADILAECGYRYDASVYPVRHDRYGIAQAPRNPFWLVGKYHRILELPALTLRLLGRTWAVGGGGHFRLWPLIAVKAGLHQVTTLPVPVGVLYFHPWEFDPEQPRLPLRGPNRWRTYVGIRRTTRRLQHLLQRYQFVRARDVAEQLLSAKTQLPRFILSGAGQAASELQFAKAETAC